MNLHICTECSCPITGAHCVNPGCPASGNVPPEILARRAKQAAEAEERTRFSRIRSQSYGKES